MQHSKCYYKYFGISSILAVLSLLCKAQYEQKDFVLYNVKHGLSDNYVTSFVQDDHGFMWIGTDMGLNQFDGHRFRTFFQGSKDFPLASSKVLHLKKFSDHRLGILGFSGFQMLNTQTSTLKNYFISDSSAFNRYLNGVQDAVELPEKKILLSTATGIYLMDSNSRILFRHDAYKATDPQKLWGIYGRNIISVRPDEHLVYVNNRDLSYLNTKSYHYKVLAHGQKHWGHFQHPMSATDDGWQSVLTVKPGAYLFLHRKKDSIVYYNAQQNKLVASHVPVHVKTVFNWESRMVKLDSLSFAINDAQNGFYTFQLDADKGTIQFSNKKHMDAYKILSLFMDKDKRLWVGTTQGVLQQRLQQPVLQTFSFPTANKDTLTGGISAVYRHKNKIYLGRFSRRFGLLIADTASMKAIKQISFFGKDNMWNEIRTIQMYHADTLWLGTNTGIIWFDTKTEHYGVVKDEENPRMLQNFSAVLFPVNTDGYAWACSMLGGVVARYKVSTRSFQYFTLATKPALPFSKVKSVVYDSYGDVWVAGHALARWNTGNQNFDTLINVYAGVNKFNDDILTITADDKGSLWLHNAYNDLLEYRIKEKIFLAYTEKDGLPNDEIRCLSPARNQALWMGSHNHLALMDLETKKFLVYDNNDGLPSERPSSRHIYFDEENGMMYMPMNNELLRFPQKKTEKPVNPGELIIMDVMVNNRRGFYNPQQPLQLKSDENNLAIHFAVIDFEDRNNYRFAYMLREADGWVSLGEQRSITLTGLSSGHYEISIKGIGKSGDVKWKTVRFSISPPFFKSSEFIAAVCLALLSLFYFLYRYRIKQIKQKANLDKQLAQTEMKALHAQMNPHFIFNSLNSIREMILNNENNEASHFLGKFAQLIRMTLNQTGKTFITLSQTIDYLTRYMEMEQIRNSFFTCRILAADELDINDSILPPMLIQPFIENALWHGTKPNDKNININIDFKKENDQLVCIIEDNGIGIAQSLKNKEIQSEGSHTSVGIANIKNRIALLNEKYNLQCSIRIEDKKVLQRYKDSGTLVTITLPIQIVQDV